MPPNKTIHIHVFTVQQIANVKIIKLHTYYVSNFIMENWEQY